MNNTLLSSVLIATLLAGCNSSDSQPSNTSTTPVKKIGMGYYVDSAVSGITYTCGTEVGTTDDLGLFTFEEGEDCQFTIGDIVLREIKSSLLEDKITVLENNISVAQLLQTLDSDGDPSNGIDIDSEAVSRVLKRTIFTPFLPMKRNSLKSVPT